MGSAITADGVTCWSTQAISDDWVLPTTAAGSTLTLDVRACKGQYASLSFCLRSTESAELMVNVTNPDSPAPQVDVRYVLVWWQNTVIWPNTPVGGWVPELLVKNPNFVTTDPVTHVNTPVSPLVDSPTLLPITLAANTTQQYWITVFVPAAAVAGDYEIDVAVTKGGNACLSFHVNVTVLPFALAQPSIKYGVYNMSCLGTSGTEISETLYAAQLADMAAHGIKYPVIWQDLMTEFWSPGGSKTALSTILSLRAAAGIVNDPLLIGRIGVQWTYAGTYDGSTPPYLDNRSSLLYGLNAAKKWFAARGVDQLYVMGFDEPTESGQEARFADQKLVWQAIQAVDVTPKIRTWTDLMEGSYADAAFDFLTSGAELDLALTNSEDYDCSEWHGIGHEVGLYGPTTFELPESYFRRRYGLRALRAGYDWVIPWAYFQVTSGGTFWNDVESVTKDHCLAYTCSDGSIVSTIQYEGYREGINDARFAATMTALTLDVPNEVGQDLDTLRETMIDAILEVPVEAGDDKLCLILKS
jgi:hypothetical protein